MDAITRAIQEKVRDDMTREEAIFCEKSYLGETNCIDCKYYGTDTCKSRESHKMAIKALEQEPETYVLDKIREEIEEAVLESLSDGGEDWFVAEKVNKCLDIIDKYKSESEE